MADEADLGRKIETAIEELLASGHYGSREEILRAGVLLVQERERAEAELEARLELSLAAAEAGEVRPAEEVFTELKERYRNWKRA